MKNNQLENEKVWRVVFYFLFVLGLLSAGLAYFSVRFPFWLPDFILRSLTKVFWVEHPRGDSFVVFQIPGMILHLLFGLTDSVLLAKIKVLNFVLSFYQILGLIFCVRVLSQQGKYHLIPYPLLAYGLLYPYAAATTFNGAPQAMFFFWILMCVDFDFSKIKNRIAHLVLFVLFYFCYPPFSFVGSLVMLIKSIKDKQKFAKWVSLVGIAFSSIHLLFLKSLFSGQTYDETFYALFTNFKEPHFYFLCSFIAGVGVLLILPIVRDKKVVWASVAIFCVTAVYLWLLGLLAFPNNVLNMQYLNRIYVYTGSAVLAVFMLMADSQFNRRLHLKGQLQTMYFLAALAMLLGIVSDLRTSNLYIRYTNVIANELEKSAEKCVETDLDIMADAGVSQWQYPYYTIFQWEKFSGRIVYSKAAATGNGQRGLPLTLKKYCNDPNALSPIDLGPSIWSEL